MKKVLKLALASGLLVCLLGWLAYTLFASGGGPIVQPAERKDQVAAESLDHVAALVTDPFFHPAIQPVLPPTTPPTLAGPLLVSPHAESPAAPVLQGPLVAYPSPSAPPQPLPGSIPSASTGQTPAVESEPQVRVSLQGLVVGERPAAFIRINDSPSTKVAAGAALPGGVTVLEISEQHVILSRKGKSLKLKPGQAENL